MRPADAAGQEDIQASDAGAQGKGTPRVPRLEHLEQLASASTRADSAQQLAVEPSFSASMCGLAASAVSKGDKPESLASGEVGAYADAAVDEQQQKDAQKQLLASDADVSFLHAAAAAEKADVEEEMKRMVAMTPRSTLGSTGAGEQRER